MVGAIVVEGATVVEAATVVEGAKVVEGTTVVEAATVVEGGTVAGPKRKDSIRTLVQVIKAKYSVVACSSLI